MCECKASGLFGKTNDPLFTLQLSASSQEHGPTKGDCCEVGRRGG